MRRELSDVGGSLGALFLIQTPTGILNADQQTIQKMKNNVQKNLSLGDEEGQDRVLNFFELLNIQFTSYLYEYDRFSIAANLENFARESNLTHDSESNFATFQKFWKEHIYAKNEKKKALMKAHNVDPHILLISPVGINSDNDGAIAPTYVAPIHKEFCADGKTQPQIVLFDKLAETHMGILKETKSGYWKSDEQNSDKAKTEDDEYRNVIIADIVDTSEYHYPLLSLPSCDSITLGNIPLAEINCIAYLDISVHNLNVVFKNFLSLWKCMQFCLQTGKHDLFNIKKTASLLFPNSPDEIALLKACIAPILKDDIFTRDILVYIYRKLKYHPVFNTTNPDNIAVMKEFQSKHKIVGNILSTEILPTKGPKDPSHFLIFKNVITLRANTRADILNCMSNVSKLTEFGNETFTRLFGASVTTDPFSNKEHTVIHSTSMELDNNRVLVPVQRVFDSKAFTNDSFMSRTLLSSQFIYKTRPYDINKFVFLVNVIQQIFLKGEIDFVKYMDKPHPITKPNEIYSHEEHALIRLMS